MKSSIALNSPFAKFKQLLSRTPTNCYEFGNFFAVEIFPYILFIRSTFSPRGIIFSRSCVLSCIQGKVNVNLLRVFFFLFVVLWLSTKSLKLHLKMNKNIDKVCRVCMIRDGSQNIFKKKQISATSENNIGGSNSSNTSINSTASSLISSPDKLLEKLRYVTLIKVINWVVTLPPKKKFPQKYSNHSRRPSYDVYAYAYCVLKTVNTIINL